MDEAPGDVTSGLIDLSEVDLAGLDELGNPVLASALRSIRDEIDNREEAIAGFNDSL